MLIGADGGILPPISFQSNFSDAVRGVAAGKMAPSGDFSLFLAERGSGADSVQPRIMRLTVQSSGLEKGTRSYIWFDPELRLLRDPQELQMSTDGSRLYVSDATLSHVLVVDALQMTVLGCFGEGSMQSPYGIVECAGKIYVSEEGAHRISVWSPARPHGSLVDFELSRYIGGKGVERGQFRRPRGIAVAASPAQGHPLLLVAEAKRLQLLTLTGEPLQLIELPSRAGTLWGCCACWATGTFCVSDGTQLHVFESGARRITAKHADVVGKVRRRPSPPPQSAAQRRLKQRRQRRWQRLKPTQSNKRAKEREAQRAAAAAAAKMQETLNKRESERAAAKIAADEAAKTKREAAKRAAQETADKSVKAVAAKAAAAAAERKAKEDAFKAKQEAVEKILRAEAEARAKEQAARHAARQSRAAEANQRAAQAAAKNREKHAAAARAAAAAAERVAATAAEHGTAEEVAAAEELKAKWYYEAERLAAEQRANEAASAAASRRAHDEVDDDDAGAAGATGSEPEPEEKGVGDREESAKGEGGEDDEVEEDDGDGAAFHDEEVSTTWRWRWPWERIVSEEEAAAAEVEEERVRRAQEAAAARAWAQEADAERAAAEVAARAALTGAADSGLREVHDERMAERDAAVKRILAKQPRCRSLRQAVGLNLAASDAEVNKKVLKLLRLLHPDFSLNLSIKGTKQHARIEAAFKRLAGLRDERAG